MKAKTLFEEQLLERRKLDDTAVEWSLIDVADSLHGRSRYHLNDSASDNLQHVLEKIFAYFEVQFPDDIPSGGLNDIIEYVTRPVGITHRRVQMEQNWWKNGDGPILAVFRKNGQPVALIPDRVSGYRYTDIDGEKRRVTKETHDIFEREAVCFYRPLPQEPMTGKDLIRFLFRHISKMDYLMILAATVIISLIGLLLPFATKIIFSQIIPTGSLLLVYSISVLLLATAVATYLMSVARTGLLDRIRQRMEVLLENAVMNRLVHLPPKFFQGKSVGGLSQSVLFLRSLPSVITDAILGPLLTTALSVVYIVQIASVAPSIAIPSLCVFVVQSVVILISMHQKMELLQQELAGEIETQGIIFPVITGIQRIRLSSCEKRIVAQWAQAYKKKAGAAFRVVFPYTFQNEIVTAITLLGTLWVYAVGATNRINVAQFASFLSAFGVATSNLMMLSQSGQTLAYLRPILDMIEPVLKAVPEIDIRKRVVEKLHGDIELKNVSFRYRNDQPMIVDDLNLTIKAGEYVAIVGKSGCGKSTILRLLMGFEKPEIGTVSYDNVNLEELDPVSVRKNIGTVLQNGQLFTGDIFSNITISAPHLTMKDAWEAAEKAGIADTIRRMPMGMHTLISEGSGGISGGQKQRLLIARAIAPKPKILMFDEATSALDNITQKTVSNSLEQLKCTRIVVAHRLSTIQNCDRIIVFDHGKIVEDGSYEELIARNGFFADLVSRQQLN